MIKYNLATMQSLSNRTSKKLPILPSVLFIDGNSGRIIIFASFNL